MVDNEGKQLGETSLIDALKKAAETGLDLVEVAPNAKPPVCKIMDYGRHVFKSRKEKKKQVRKKSVKEIKLRPVTGEGDYQVKLKQILGFIQTGHKVKVIMRFRNRRELNFQDLAVNMINRLVADTSAIAQIDQEAKLEGRQMVMILSPQATM